MIGALPERARVPVLALVCLVLFLPGFFTLPPFDRDEARFAQASRQMLESGDFVDIRFQGEARHKKPVGIYWLQAASAGAAGGSAAAPIGAYRVPSLLGAIAAVLLTFWAGRALFGSGPAWIAALILAGTVVLGVEARMAKTDAVLLATIVAAQGALARVYLAPAAGPAGWRWPLVFWAALGVGILVKGPIAPMIAGLTVLALVAADRQAAWLGRLRPVLGLVVVSALVSPWLVAITLKTGGAFFAESVGHDLLGKVASGQESKGLPPGYYIASFWVTFAPFAPLALLAAPWVWHRRQRPAVRFCLAWLVPNWIVFELVATKLLHYTMPVFPAVALLIAAAAADQFDRTAAAPRRRLFIAATLLGTVALVGLAVGLAAVPWLLDHRLNPLGVAMAATVALFWTLGVARLWRRAEQSAVVALLGAAAVLAGIGYPALLERTDGLWVSRQAAQAVTQARRCPTTQVAAAGYSEPSLVFLVGTDTILGGAATAADHLRADPRCALALVEERELADFRTALGTTAAVPITSVEGFNYSRGKPVRLTLFRHQE